MDENLLVPLGVTKLFIPSIGRHGKCNTDLRPPSLSAGHHYELPESCSQSTSIPDSSISISYDIITRPYVYNGKMKTEEDWPFKLYPRDSWPALEKEMQAYLQGLLYQENNDNP